MKKIIKSINDKEKRILSITLATWGVFLIISGLIMNLQVKPIVKTKYTVQIKNNKISEAQAKTNEIKLKELEIEINNPISVNIADYLEDYENISEKTLKSLKLDTSLVNINQPGTYQYTITYKKKKYISTITVKEKELPNVSFTLNTIKLKTGDSLSSNPRTFISENISEEVYNNITLDISKVDTRVQGDYTYYIIYKGVTYQGKVEVRNPGPTVITPNTQTTTDDTKQNNKNTQTQETTITPATSSPEPTTTPTEKQSLN